MTDRRLLSAALLGVVGVSLPLLVGGGVDVPDDAAYYGVASWEWLREAVTSGQNPWWVPGKLGGVSLFSDVVPQGPLYPTALLALVLPAIPALGIAALVHAVGSLLAVRWLARIHGVRDELATLAGAAVAMGPLGVWAAVDYQVDTWPVFVWFPMTLGCLERAAETEARARLRWLALGAAAVGLLLLGTHLRVSIGAGGALALWALVRGRDLPGAVVVGGLGLLAGMPLVLPMLMEGRIQGAGGGSPFGAPDQAVGLWNVAGWLAPKATLHARDLGIGAVLGTGLIAAALLERERRRLLLFVGLLVLAGSHLPGVRFVMAPLTALTRPVNLVYAALALIPAAVLGAMGIERLLAARGAGRTRVIQLAAVFAAFAVLRLALGRWTLPSNTAWLHYGLAVGQLAIVGLVVRSIWTRRDPVPLLVLVGLLDLFAFGLRAHLAVPSLPLRATSDLGGDAALIADGYLDVEDLAGGFDASLRMDEDAPEDTEEDVVAAEAEAPVIQRRINQRVWPVHACMAAGCRGWAGRSKMAPARATALLAPVAEELADLGADQDVVRHLFGERGMGRRLLEVTGVARALRGDAVVAEVLADRRSPRCSAIESVSVVEDADDRVARLLDTPWWERPRIVEAPIEIPALPRVSCTDPTEGVQVDGPGAITVALPMHPGWRVTADGATLDPFPVDQVHQGVVTQGGLLRWRFEPPGLRLGVLLGGLAWLLIGALLVRSRGVAPVAALLLLLPGVAFADSIDGVVRDAPQTGAEAWLATSLDLTRGDQPVARAPVIDGRFTLEVPPGSGSGWVFLRQEVPVEGGPPLVFHRPASLDPFDLAAPPASVRVAAVPEELARRRASGLAPAGWWQPPLVLALLVFVGAPLLRRRLLAAGRGTGLRPDLAAPRAEQPPPDAVDGRERKAILALLGVAIAIRLPGLTAPLDFLEWSYGPGTARVLAEGESVDLLDALLHPSCLELVHPPLWHALMQLLALTESELLMRLPALGASVGTVALLWWLMRRVSPATGLLAALGYAVATPAVEFGRDATPYAFLSFVAVGSLVLLLRALRSGEARAWAAWLGLLVLGFLCHYATALFGGAQLLVLLYLWARHRSDGRWRGAAAQALGVGPVIGAPAIAWAFLHFANFSPVALDTRLYADTYPADPGLATFLVDFGAVALGIAPGIAIFALPVAILATLGLVNTTAKDRTLGLLLAGVVGAFAGGTLFFYANLIQSLDGRIFWGFRWVSWFLPAALALAASGLASTRGAARLASGALGGIWLLGTLSAAYERDLASTHPDYRGAAAHIADHLADRDGLVTLPMWGQRGPVRSYLTWQLDGTLTELHDTTAWDFDGKAAYLEAGDERLPFESGALNTHVDRLWLVIADERMFGRAKFSDPIALRAVEWARATLRPVERRELDHLTLILFERPALPPPSILDPVDLRSRPYLEPNTPLCGPGDDRWRLHVRLEAPPAEVSVEGGVALPSVDSEGWSAVVEGGPCSGPAPRIRFGHGVTHGRDDQIP